MQTANRVVFNTLLIYAKSAITIFISLYTTRIVLNTLGVEDFGLFNVIGGLVAMLSFLNATMSTATQRFISFNKGTNNINKVKQIFANSMILHIGVSILVILILEIIGLYFLNYKLTIPFDKIKEANILFHFVVATTFISIISVPNDAVLNANENMAFLAVMNILEYLLKLILALYIYIIPKDKLIYYGFFLMLIGLIIIIIKHIYVRRNYEESRVNYKYEYRIEIIKDLTTFASWNLFGVFSYLGRNQGLAILINVFFGTVVNAAYAIANQVTSQISFFSVTMLQAINPQIMKNEGAENRNKMIVLSFVASKFGFLLLSIVAIPIIFEIKFILSLWLLKVPAHTSDLCVFVLIALMINQITIGIDSAIHASGNIKKYMLAVGSMKLGVLPIAYMLLKFNYSLDSIFYVYIFLEGLAGLVRMFILRSNMGIPISTYLNHVIIKILPVIVITILFNIIIVCCFDFYYRFLLTIPISIIVFIFTSYYLALNEEEKIFFKKNLKKIIIKCSSILKKK